MIAKKKKKKRFEVQCCCSHRTSRSLFLCLLSRSHCSLVLFPSFSLLSPPPRLSVLSQSLPLPIPLSLPPLLTPHPLSSLTLFPSLSINLFLSFCVFRCLRLYIFLSSFALSFPFGFYSSPVYELRFTTK